MISHQVLMIWINQDFHETFPNANSFFSYSLSFHRSWLLRTLLVHWHYECVTIHHEPKCMSCHKTVVVITGNADCFHDFTYILTLILLLQNLCTLHVVCHLWPFVFMITLCESCVTYDIRYNKCLSENVIVTHHNLQYILCKGIPAKPYQIHFI